MGRNLPYNRTDALERTLSHLDRWEDVAGEIGLDEQGVQSIVQAAQAAREAMIQAEIARARAKAATATWHRLADAMKAEVSTAIVTIKATAAQAGQAQGDPAAERAVYGTAWLSYANKPGVAPAPDEPGQPTTGLDNNGAAVLAWTGKGPAGTRYAVRRQLEGETGWTAIGDTHEKAFVDRTLPAGTPSVAYQVVAKYGPHAVAGVPTVMRLGSAPAQTRAAMAGGLALQRAAG
ncbi:MAG: hypothetical protein NCW75_09430 [Phycisphaera sp.]|nr:MAG: hypothetical protein NCW75_09430 [Phycisphaera sp.]